MDVVIDSSSDNARHLCSFPLRKRTSIIALLLSRRVLYAQSPTRAARVQRGLRATLSVRAPANITPHVQPAVLGPPCLCRHLTRRVADGEGSALPGPTSSAKINARMPRDIRWTRLDAFATLCTSFRHVSERPRVRVDRATASPSNPPLPAKQQSEPRWRWQANGRSRVHSSKSESGHSGHHVSRRGRACMPPASPARTVSRRR